MAQQLSASIYGLNGNSFGSALGNTMGFPTQGILIRPAPIGTVIQSITMATIIQLLPSGTRVAQDQYFTNLATATAITNSNA